MDVQYDLDFFFNYEICNYLYISYESSDSKLDVSRDGLNLYMLCMYQESFPQNLGKHCNEHDSGEILDIQVPARGWEI